MSLSPGAKLGPYEVGAPIGAGGMGQVYKAVDSRLGRQVAIKVLPLSSLSPTALGTMAGMVMGTVGYLAPEQAAGLPVDRRADIFSLGCILMDGMSGCSTSRMDY